LNGGEKPQPPQRGELSDFVLKFLALLVGRLFPLTGRAADQVELVSSNRIARVGLHGL
jgi:hypothetical protein